MISQFASQSFHPLYLVGKIFNFLPNHKKSGFGIISLQTVQKPVGKRTGPVIKGQGYIFFLLRFLLLRIRSLFAGGFFFRRFCLLRRFFIICFLFSGFVALQGTVRQKLIAFSFCGNKSGLHNTVQIHKIPFTAVIHPSGFHNPTAVKKITLSICICKPACIRLSVYHKHPVASAGSPHPFFCFRRNFKRHWCSCWSGCR